MIRVISTANAPTPRGHYSQAVVANGLVFVAGQVAIDPKTQEPKPGPIEEQTHQVLANLAAILDAAGTTIERVVKTTVYLSDMSLFGRVNEVYAEFFGDHCPARAIVPVRELRNGLQVEIEAIALAE